MQGVAATRSYGECNRLRDCGEHLMKRKRRYGRYGHYSSRYPNFSRAFFITAGLGALTGGNLSRQKNGRHASMIARELVKFPFAFSSGLMRGSSGVLQALCTMSIDVAGSERVSIAQISSSRFDTSMSSSTTMTYLPAYAPTWHWQATWPACVA